MAYEVNGKTLETNASGYLENLEDWNKDVASEIAKHEGITLTPAHWDLIEFLRDRYFNHNAELANNRAIVKAMQEKWPDKKVDQKAVFDLFPGNPSKQAGKIAGLPESMRKGGY